MSRSKSRLLASICLSFFVLTPPTSGKAAEKAALLVPVDDHVLASLAMAALGQQRPVLLFDPRDADLLERYAGESDRSIECLRRPETPSEIAALMEQTAGTACTVMNDPIGLATKLWPGARAAILVDPLNDSWLLHAAAFGAATTTAVVPLAPSKPIEPEVFDQLGFHKVYLTPPFHARTELFSKTALETVDIDSPDDLIAELLRRLPTAPTALIVANPKDRQGIFSPLLPFTARPTGERSSPVSSVPD
jgi:hypothetical protein